MSGHGVTLRDVFSARQRIASIAKRTPLVRSSMLTKHLGVPVYLKLENLQETGAFKIRGASNRFGTLTTTEKEQGVITVSSGNHGRAVAHVAKRLGIPAVVCMSERVPMNKVEGIKRYGAEVVISGQDYDEAEEMASQLQAERGLTRIDPFDDRDVIAGQGTIGLELLEDLPGLETVLVPLSGGGLISGVALVLKTADPAIRVIGVSMDRGPVMAESLRVGRLVQMEEEPSLADALVGGIPLDNRYTFHMCQTYVDETVLVSEEEIARGVVFALEKHRLVVEGGGAVGIAALLSGKVSKLSGKVAVVVSGGNIDIPLLLQIANEYSEETVPFSK